MGHELLSTDNMVSANGRKPWHFHLGTPVNLVDGELELADAPAAAGLDWLTENRPSYYPVTVGINPDGSEAIEYREAPDKRTVIRADTDLYLGTVGTIHTDVQNQEYFDLAGALMAEGEGRVLIETAGSLKGCKVVWVLAKLDKDMTVNGDQHDIFLLIAGAHDGSMALRVQTTLMRVVCWNTLSWAINNQAQYWVARHSTNVGQRIDEIKQALGLSWNYVDAWENEVRKMMDTTVRPVQFDRFVERLIPLEPNPTDRIVRAVGQRRDQVRAIHEGQTVAPFTGTAWGAFNAGTEWSQWARPVQSATRAERQADKAVGGELVDENTRIKALITQVVPELAQA